MVRTKATATNYKTREGKDNRRGIPSPAKKQEAQLARDNINKFWLPNEKALDEMDVSQMEFLRKA